LLLLEVFSLLNILLLQAAVAVVYRVVVLVQVVCF